MEIEGLIKQAKRIIKSDQTGPSILAESLEFLRLYSGEKSSFFKQLSKVNQTWSDDYIQDYVKDTLNAFIRFLENGLADGISVERRAQIDVVSDFLDQARILLDTKGVHAAAPCVLIGASLEEFLRNWVEEAGLSVGQAKPSLDSLSKTLKNEELLTKQDMKDIASWGGLRNHAAHGEWDEVNDKRRIALMLEGVNLFMRKYGKE